jgi:hypothetical protein
LDDGVTSKRDLRSICTIKKSLACTERKGLGFNIRVEPMLDGAEKLVEIASILLFRARDADYHSSAGISAG